MKNYYLTVLFKRFFYLKKKLTGTTIQTAQTVKVAYSELCKHEVIPYNRGVKHQARGPETKPGRWKVGKLLKFVCLTRFIAFCIDQDPPLSWHSYHTKVIKKQILIFLFFRNRQVFFHSIKKEDISEKMSVFPRLFQLFSPGLVFRSYQLTIIVTAGATVVLWNE